MVFLSVVVGIIVVALGLAVWYDHRAKLRGWRVGASTEKALHARLDVETKMAEGDAQSPWGRRDE